MSGGGNGGGGNGGGGGGGGGAGLGIGSGSAGLQKPASVTAVSSSTQKRDTATSFFFVCHTFPRNLVSPTRAKT